MKRIQLRVPQPCHENWHEMTKEDKGRFCNSCSKTVVDFSTMKDREIAQFFKKKRTDVCGHFRSDQLERDLLIPKKRIPWFRYFFQIAWPAMVMTLKSCTGNRNYTDDKEQLDGYTRNPEFSISYLIGDEGTSRGITGDSVYVEEPVQIDGMVAVQNKPASPVRKRMTPKPTLAEPEMIKCEQGPVDTIMEGEPMDTVKVMAYGTTTGAVTTGLGVQRWSEIREVPDSPLAPQPHDAHIPDASISVFPNPASSGSTITISVSHGSYTPIRILLFTASGQRVLEQQTSVLKFSSSMRLHIPSNLTAGTYFLTLADKQGMVKTKQVIIH